MVKDECQTSLRPSSTRISGKNILEYAQESLILHELQVSSRDSYENFKLLTDGIRFRPQGCYENIANGQKVLECVHINYNSDKKPVHAVFRRTHL